MAFYWRSMSGLLAGAALALAACSSDKTTGPTDLPPNGAAVTAPSATSARITWNKLSDATSYSVERAVGASGGTFAVISAAGLTDTTYLDTGLEPSAAYRYRVQAVRASGASQYSTEVSVTTKAPGTAAATISANITASRTLYADTTYTLSGFIQVANGATLTIKPGTKVLGDFG